MTWQADLKPETEAPNNWIYSTACFRNTQISSSSNRNAALKIVSFSPIDIEFTLVTDAISLVRAGNTATWNWNGVAEIGLYETDKWGRPTTKFEGLFIDNSIIIDGELLPEIPLSGSWRLTPGRYYLAYYKINGTNQAFTNAARPTPHFTFDWRPDEDNYINVDTAYYYDGVAAGLSLSDTELNLPDELNHDYLSIKSTRENEPNGINGYTLPLWAIRCKAESS